MPEFSFSLLFRPDSFVWWMPPLALLLDMLLADPRCLPHPVRGIAFLAARLEGPARRTGYPLVAGVLAMLVLLLVTGGVVLFFISLPYGLGGLAALYFAWSGLALGGLLREGKSALRLVEQAGRDADALPEARGAVQMLVSRETQNMDADDLCRSLAESVSENLNDAFVAPFFWLLLGGPVGLWLYKCASTMDSLWGYKNERWLLLGRAAARLDDLLAWIPARLTVLLMWLAAWIAHVFRLTRLSFRSDEHAREYGNSGSGNPVWKLNVTVPGWPGWPIVIRQARLSASPNAGWPMAAAAWLFNGKTGGPTVYHGQVVQKPVMGPEQGRWTVAGTAALIRHARLVGVLAGVLGTALFWAVLALLR